MTGDAGAWAAASAMPDQRWDRQAGSGPTGVAGYGVVAGLVSGVDGFAVPFDVDPEPEDPVDPVSEPLSDVAPSEDPVDSD